MTSPAAEAGVFPVQAIRDAQRSGIIATDGFALPEGAFQPASLDLHLGGAAHRLRCSFLPGNRTVREQLADYGMGQVPLGEGGILEQDRPYLIPLAESLVLPPGVMAKANPKSSTGRLDIFTRVITDASHRFDQIATGYRGPLYLEVVSRSFTVRVQSHLSLNQLRLVKGNARCSDEDLARLHASTPILYVEGKPVKSSELPLLNGLLLSVDLKGDEQGMIGYRAKKNSQLLDLTVEPGHYHPDAYWEPVSAEPKRRLVLEPEEFYLLVSREAVCVPPHLAAEMTAYDPTSGELRTHYAGFFDPGFGYDRTGALTGTRAVMEVRAHDVPFMIEHGQQICRLEFERMLSVPEVLYGERGSHYQKQALTLSKYFGPRAAKRRLV